MFYCIFKATAFQKEVQSLFCLTSDNEGSSFTGRIIKEGEKIELLILFFFSHLKTRGGERNHNVGLSIRFGL